MTREQYKILRSQVDKLAQMAAVSEKENLPWIKQMKELLRSGEYDLAEYERQ